MKIHTGDSVLVISGKDRGKSGTVIRVIETQNRVVVEGINMCTRHVKKTYQQAGRIIKYERSIAASNVMILDPKTKKPSRIGYKVDEKGHKIRISKISGEEVKIVKAKAVKKAEKIKDAPEKTEKDTSAKKSPFWKKMGFGASVDSAETKEPNRSHQDHSVPDQQTHSRSSGRGS
jgi:large subunit ribosomal protein L24